MCPYERSLETYLMILVPLLLTPSYYNKRCPLHFLILWFDPVTVHNTMVCTIWALNLNLVLKHVNLFSCVKSVRCSPFLFDKLCKLDLLFTFLPIYAFMSLPMMRTLCFMML